jgi:hypothetical protein
MSEEAMEKPKKPKAKKENDTVKKILGGAEKASKEPVKMKGGEEGKVHGMHIHHMKSGGYHIHHTDEHKMPIPGDEHAVPDMDALHDHLEANMAGAEPNDGEQEAMAGPAGAGPAAQPQPPAQV